MTPYTGPAVTSGLYRHYDVNNWTGTQIPDTSGNEGAAITALTSNTFGSDYSTTPPVYDADGFYGAGSLDFAVDDGPAHQFAGARATISGLTSFTIVFAASHEFIYGSHNTIFYTFEGLLLREDGVFKFEYPGGFFTVTYPSMRPTIWTVTYDATTKTLRIGTDSNPFNYQSAVLASDMSIATLGLGNLYIGSNMDESTGLTTRYSVFDVWNRVLSDAELRTEVLNISRRPEKIVGHANGNSHFASYRNSSPELGGLARLKSWFLSTYENGLWYEPDNVDVGRPLRVMLPDIAPYNVDLDDVPMAGNSGPLPYWDYCPAMGIPFLLETEDTNEEYYNISVDGLTGAARTRRTSSRSIRYLDMMYAVGFRRIAKLGTLPRVGVPGGYRTTVAADTETWIASKAGQGTFVQIALDNDARLQDNTNSEFYDPDQTHTNDAGDLVKFETALKPATLAVIADLVDSVAPTVSTVTVNAAGTLATFSFLESGSPPLLPATGVTGLGVSGHTLSSVVRATATTITATISPTVYSDEMLTASATNSNVTDSFTPPNALANVSVIAVSNSSVQTRPVVATPVFAPVAGTYTEAQDVTITSATSGATIRYTADGSTPTPSSGTIYSGPINVSTTTTTIKAIAYKAGLTDSAVATGTFTINVPGPTVATPVIALTAGSYTGAQTTTITCATSGAAILYSLDGTTPSIAYTGAITIPVGTTTLKAKAAKNSYVDSVIVTAVYVINSPEPGTAVILRQMFTLGEFPQSATITSLKLTAGDTSGSLAMPIVNDSGAAILLTGSETVVFNIRLKGETETAIDDAEAFLTAPDRFGVRAAYFDFDTDNPVPAAGTYEATFKVAGLTYPVGRKQPVLIQEEI